MHVIVIGAFLISCQAIPQTEENLAEVREAAARVLPEHLLGRAYEKTELKRCGAGTDIESLNFTGTFPVHRRTHDIHERSVVICELRHKERSISRGCTLTRERILAFPGIEQGVELAEEAAEAEVREFLQQLAERTGEVVDGEIFSADQFRSISKVHASPGNGESGGFSAIYAADGCSSRSLSAVVRRHPTLTIVKLGRSFAIC